MHDYCVQVVTQGGGDCDFCDAHDAPCGVALYCAAHEEDEPPGGLRGHVDFVDGVGVAVVQEEVACIPGGEVCRSGDCDACGRPVVRRVRRACFGHFIACGELRGLL